MEKGQYGWWRSDGILRHGDGRKAEVGMTHTVPGLPVLCYHGLHASPDVCRAIFYGEGYRLYFVRLGGPLDQQYDKACAASRTYLHQIPLDMVLDAFYRHIFRRLLRIVSGVIPDRDEDTLRRLPKERTLCIDNAGAVNRVFLDLVSRDLEPISKAVSHLYYVLTSGQNFYAQFDSLQKLHRAMNTHEKLALTPSQALDIETAALLPDQVVAEAVSHGWTKPEWKVFDWIA